MHSLAQGLEVGHLGFSEQLTFDPGSVLSTLPDGHLSPLGQLPSVNKMGVY